MAVAHTIEDALQLRSGLANVLIDNAEPIARGVLQAFAPVLSDFLPWHTNSAQSYVKPAIELLPRLIAHDLYHIPDGKLR